MRYPGGMAVLGVAAIVLCGTAARAQSPVAIPLPPGAEDPAPVCYGFTFGTWTPALDRAAAGHDPDARAGPGAPHGRSWAVSDSGSASSLILFPAWWPAGMRVTLPAGPPPVGRSARGTAIALVADGRRRPPAAPVVVHGVPCTGDGARREPRR